MINWQSVVPTILAIIQLIALGDGKACAQTPDKYALLIGVTNYSHPDLNDAGLRYPEADATVLGSTLAQHGYEVEKLLGRAATRAAIIEKLRGLKTRGANNGVVFVGVFGHGIEFESTKVSYFCPYDTSFQDVVDADGKKQFKDQPAKNAEVRVEPDPESLVSIDSLLVSLKTSLATNRILVADCCRDDPNRPRAIGRSFGSSLNINQLPERTVALFACDAKQQAFEHPDWGHGALTKCLLEQIQKAPKDRPVLMGSIAQDVKPEVERLVDLKLIKKQTPRFLITDRVDLMLSESMAQDRDYNLGLEFYRGKDRSIDQIKALRYFRKAAERGHPVAMAFVGNSCWNGWGGNTVDLVKAVEWYRKAIPKLHLLAEADDTEAQVALAFLNEEGIGTYRDANEAFRWYKRASELGNVAGTVGLGSCYERGYGVEVDHDDMAIFYEIAAKKGDPEGMVAIGTALSLGRGIKKNLDQSAMWYHRAAELGLPVAMHSLSHCYFTGDGVEKDLVKAFDWMKLSYEAGRRNSCWCYASHYFDGVGTVKDQQKGLDVLLENASTDHSVQEALARRIRDGDGVEKNEDGAKDWEKLAFETTLKEARSGLAYSVEKVAAAFLSGVGTEPNKVEAFRWGVKSVYLNEGSETLRKLENEIDDKDKFHNRVYKEVEQIAQTEKDTLFMMVNLVLMASADPFDGKTFEARSKEFLLGQPLSYRYTNNVAWNIYELTRDGKLSDKKLLTIARKAAEATLRKTSPSEKSMLLDTIAHLCELEGNLQDAIIYQNEAIAFWGDAPDKKKAIEYLELLKSKR